MQQHWHHVISRCRFVSIQKSQQYMYTAHDNFMIFMTRRQCFIVTFINYFELNLELMKNKRLITL